jgi:hypothetical protein
MHMGACVIKSDGDTVREAVRATVRRHSGSRSGRVVYSDSFHKPVPTTPHSPGGGTSAHSVLTSHNTPVPTTP